MRKVARWAACVACLLGGCATLNQYEQGKAAAKAEVESARKDFGPAAEQMVASSILSQGHYREGKPEEWRKGYEAAIREELSAPPAPPPAGVGE
jgi:hypothetical protein